MTDSPAAAAPAASADPFAEVKARAAAAVEDARVELLDLSHRIHANPEPAFEEVQAAAWVAEAIRAHGFAVEHPVGSLATAVRGRITGGKGGGRAPDRDPRRVRRASRASATAAATTPWPRRGSGRRSPSRRCGTRGPARSCSSGRRRRSGGAARRS